MLQNYVEAPGTAGYIGYSCLALFFVAALQFLLFDNSILSFEAPWKQKLHPSTAKGNGDKTQAKNPRCIVQRLEDTGKNCVVFYGSQTGNAQELAEQLAKEGHGRYGLETMVADLDDYDYESLRHFDSNKIAIFVLSTYGEGEPTDNAVGFWDYMQTAGEDLDDVETPPLQSMHYVAFGLGNSTYEHYNAVIRKTDEFLRRLGAQRVGVVGEGDDGNGTVEDSFLTWKDSMWASLKVTMDLQEHTASFTPSFEVVEHASSEQSIFLGERSDEELNGASNVHDGRQHPSIIKISSSQELFKSETRNCVHMELDIKGSGLSYQTGDHVAVWAMNSDLEVDRFLRVFGLLEQRHKSIKISAVDATAHAPIPTPTTYDAAVRYYLEIARPVSRQHLATIAEFASSADQKKALLRLNEDKDLFRDVVTSKLLNWAQLIETITPSDTAYTVPFAVLLECIRPLQPRYYSISSSSLVQKDTVAITAVVDAVQFPERHFYGVASNYILALKHLQNNEDELGASHSTYALSGPRNKYELSLPIHIRHSTFRLPVDKSSPIVMIGPGTGAAPFRAFVQERIEQVQRGLDVGSSVLFYGCRNASEDFLYRTEWDNATRVLGDRFKMHTAFSRQSAKKVYVQHLLLQNASDVLPPLLENKGYLYICGDVRMAHDVQTTLCELVSQAKGISLQEAETFFRNLKSSGRFQEDVW